MEMIRFKNVMIAWACTVALFALTLWLLPHEEVPFSSFASYALQALLFILSVAIVRSEPTRKNKFIFVNFAFFFATSFFSHIYNFVGKVFFAGEPFARFYFNQYVMMIPYPFLLALAIVYLTLDALFRDFKTLHKYVLSLVIVGTFFGAYYNPYFSNPKHLYTTPDATDWKAIDAAATNYQKETGEEATPETIAPRTQLHSWKSDKAVGTLYASEELERIKELYPYLHGSNYVVLFLKPLYMNTIYMSVLCVGFVMLFFGYQYLKDPPQGAYIEKIMFLLLIFCTMEILHAWSFVSSVEWQAFSDIMSLGQVLSTVVLLFIAIFFSLRLKFITSVKGEFYEQELSASPAQVTRWRDALDNIVIENFFNRKTVLGRLFVDPNHR
jgi:hypothetical protein